MMLRHGFGRGEEAGRIEAAVDAVLERGLRTPDLATGTVVQAPTSESPAPVSEVGTAEMTAAVLEELS
jgi:isocitrate/isopropylmalate dehydrogenase